MQIFASTTSFGRGRTDLSVILPAIKALGFDGVEFGSTHVWRSDLAQIIEENRLARVLTHNYFPPAQSDLVINLASNDPNVRRASIAHACACIDFAASLGAELYTVHPGFMTADAAATARHNPGTAFDFDFIGAQVPYEHAFALMRDALGDLYAYARRAGVRLAIETEGSITKPGMLLMERPEEYRRLISELGTGLLLNFNLAHSSLAAKLHVFDLVSFIKEFGEHFAAVEISHNEGERDDHHALVAGSYVFRYLPFLPDVPLILEFREASAKDLVRSKELLLANVQPFAESESIGNDSP